jgi:hypothetical protein
MARLCEAEQHIVERAQAPDQRMILKNSRRVLAHPRPGLRALQQADVPRENRAAGRLHQAIEHIEQRGLAGAGGTDHDRHRASGESSGNLPQDRAPAARHALGFDCERRRGGDRRGPRRGVGRDEMKHGHEVSLASRAGKAPGGDSPN